jgi:hypothetical protein
MEAVREVYEARMSCDIAQGIEECGVATRELGYFGNKREENYRAAYQR